MSPTTNPTFAGLLRSTTLSEPEAATLRAALRSWQNELSYFTTEELREYYPDLQGFEPLSIAEVDRLLAHLQAAQGSDNPAVSSVSTVSRRWCMTRN